MDNYTLIGILLLPILAGALYVVCRFLVPRMIKSDMPEPVLKGKYGCEVFGDYEDVVSWLNKTENVEVLGITDNGSGYYVFYRRK